MKRFLLLLGLLLPGTSQAWERIGNTNYAVTVTTVIDIVTVASYESLDPPPPNLVQGAHTWIAFADSDVAPICRQLANFADPNNPDPQVQRAGTLRGRYVLLEVASANFNAVHLPVALFARAHNQQVRVKITYSNGRGCNVTWFETCADPDHCQPPEP